MKDKIFKIGLINFGQYVKITNNGICIYNTASIYINIRITRIFISPYYETLIVKFTHLYSTPSCLSSESYHHYIYASIILSSIN
jgi:hypothetical protein